MKTEKEKLFSEMETIVSETNNLYHQEYWEEYHDAMLYSKDGANYELNENDEEDFKPQFKGTLTVENMERSLDLLKRNLEYMKSVKDAFYAKKGIKEQIFG